jgi:hypothetical protein
VNLPRENILAGTAVAAEKNSRVAGSGTFERLEQRGHFGVARFEQQIVAERFIAHSIGRELVCRDPIWSSNIHR